MAAFVSAMSFCMTDFALSLATDDLRKTKSKFEWNLIDNYNFPNFWVLLLGSLVNFLYEVSRSNLTCNQFELLFKAHHKVANSLSKTNMSARLCKFEREFRGPNFLTMSNTFFQGGEKICRGGLAPWLRAWSFALWAPASSCLRHQGPCGCFRRQCCTGGESMKQHHAWSVFLHPPINAKYEAGQATSNDFKSWVWSWARIEPNLPALLVRAQPAASLRRSSISLRSRFFKICLELQFPRVTYTLHIKVILNDAPPILHADPSFE